MAEDNVTPIGAPLQSVETDLEIAHGMKRELIPALEELCRIMNKGLDHNIITQFQLALTPFGRQTIGAIEFIKRLPVS